VDLKELAKFEEYMRKKKPAKIEQFNLISTFFFD